MKAKSRRRLLISSVAMLLVAMLALGTATFAWFTNNRTVTADGMQVVATAAKGLQITGTNGLGTDDITSEYWGPTTSFSGKAALSAVSVPYSAAPASGTAADTFGTMPAKTFYPTNVASSGVYDGSNGTNFSQWKDDATYPTVVNTQGQSATGTSGWFAAYQVGVRFTEDTDEAAAINVTGTVTIDGLDKNNQNDNDDVLKYMRVAVLTSQSAPNSSISGVAPLKVLADAQEAKAISATTPAIKSYSEFVNAGTTATWTVTGIKKSTPKYFTILVWFEGQDQHCVDQYASLQGKINVEFTY